MAKKDFYDILGVQRNASAEEIKKAYRQMALKYHPDRNPGDKAAEDTFKEASEAYSVLGNDEKKRLYDQYGHEGLRTSGGGGFQDFSFFSDATFSGFEDILGNLFGFSGGRGGGRQSRRAQRGRDVGIDVNVTMEDAYNGVEKEVQVTKERNCPACDGNGNEPGHAPVTCSTCGGSGQMRRSHGFFSIAQTCHACNGAGQVITHRCAKCKGSGRIPEQKTLKVTFPAGVDSGNRLRMTGEGEEGYLGGRPGDLYISIVVDEHDYFVRHENDLIYRMEITFAQAALGDTLKVDTFWGPEKIKVEPESQTGKIIRLKGKGFKNVNGWGRGDMLVELRVLTPTGLSKKEKDLFHQLRELELQKSGDREKSEKKKGLFN